MTNRICEIREICVREMGLICYAFDVLTQVACVEINE